MYKCRFCDFETNNYDELIKHERSCYNVKREKDSKLHKEELDRDIAKLNSVRSEWLHWCNILKERYTKDELKNVEYLFSGENMSMVNKKNINGDWIDLGYADDRLVEALKYYLG